MAEHGVTPDNERSFSHRMGEKDGALGQLDHVPDALTSTWHSPIPNVLRNHRLNGRGNGSTRAQHMHAMQRTQGNVATRRAVQRQVMNSSMEAIYGQWAATGVMGKSLGQAVDAQQNEATRNAQNAITGSQPEWSEWYSPMAGWIPELPGEHLTTTGQLPGEGVPQYNNVSPELNMYDLIGQMRGSQVKDGR